MPDSDWKVLVQGGSGRYLLRLIIPTRALAKLGKKVAAELSQAQPRIRLCLKEFGLNIANGGFNEGQNVLLGPT